MQHLGNHRVGYIRNNYQCSTASARNELAKSTYFHGYHVLIMLIVWTGFAWVYFRKRSFSSREQLLDETARLILLASGCYAG